MGRFIIFNTAQLCGITWWIQNHHRSISSPTTNSILSLMRFRQCSSTSPESSRIPLFTPLSPNLRNYCRGVGSQKERSEKHEMARKLARNVEILTCPSSAQAGFCDVYVVGTVHISQKSCEEVQEIIKFLRPEVVFLELCGSRKAVLSRHLKFKVPTVGEMTAGARKHGILAVLVGWFYAKVACELKVIPGSEFRVAYEEAIKYGGRMILGDRPAKITALRTWRLMPLREKIKLLASFLYIAVFISSPEVQEKLLKKMKYVIDMQALMFQVFSKEFPSLTETLVHERDQESSWIWKPPSGSEYKYQRRTRVYLLSLGYVDTNILSAVVGCYLVACQSILYLMLTLTTLANNL
ncbi:uncharacterized protein LOC129292998 isoform X2 [Prosopis cineraria]|uniref:uncharacterized protein LOC129292998 isoform X2 n=1 Tax=Prosopis cineraria TaxID=364024 RepID=UPI00241017D2|nr:uncharacterized protein LOC129292998 isoform X2 [Prosopis cineraria]